MAPCSSYTTDCIVTGRLSSTRNFGEADYEALLELDSEPAAARPQLSEAELGRLRTHIHHLKAEALPKRPPRLMPGSASSCADKVALPQQGCLLCRRTHPCPRNCLHDASALRLHGVCLSMV